jgi:hypothetical protein
MVRIGEQVSVRVVALVLSYLTGGFGRCRRNGVTTSVWSCGFIEHEAQQWHAQDVAGPVGACKSHANSVGWYVGGVGPCLWLGQGVLGRGEAAVGFAGWVGIARSLDEHGWLSASVVTGRKCLSYSVVCVPANKLSQHRETRTVSSGLSSSADLSIDGAKIVSAFECRRVSFHPLLMLVVRRDRGP